MLSRFKSEHIDSEFDWNCLSTFKIESTYISFYEIVSFWVPPIIN